jgi:hypothetical protein
MVIGVTVATAVFEDVAVNVPLYPGSDTLNWAVVAPLIASDVAFPGN